MTNRQLTGCRCLVAPAYCIFFVSFIAVVNGTSWGADWPQFRGPGGSGSSNDTAKLPTHVGPDRNVVWKTELPPGHSSPVVAGDRVYVTAVEDDKLWTFGLDRQTGQLLWRANAPHAELEQIHQTGSHAQSSPASDGQLVVSFFGSSGLFCYDRDGKLLWSRPMGPFSDTYGAAASPILVDDAVILLQDHDIDSFLVALDKQTGETIWSADRGEFPRGYTTPVIWNSEGRRQLVVVGALRVVGYDVATGAEIWTVRGIARLCSSTPALGDDGNIYISEWAPGGDETNRIQADPFTQLAATHDSNKNGTIELAELPPGPLKSRFPQIDRDKSGEITRAEYDWMEVIFNTAHNSFLAIRPGGVGDVTDSHVLWKRTQHLPYVPSPLYYRGHLFTVKNGGIFVSVNANTGATEKAGRLPQTAQYYSSPVAGDGKIYLVDQRGGLTVLSAGPQWKVLAQAEFGEDVYATPAIAEGRIYVRTTGHLYCFGLDQ